MKSFDDGLNEIQKLVDLGRQQWFLGAGVSVESGIPLMHPLTKRVSACLEGESLRLFNMVMADLPDDAHVEHALSHIGDLVALASRSKTKNVKVGDQDTHLEALQGTYRDVVKCIANAVRYGYRAMVDKNPEQIGTSVAPIVEVDAHLQFVRKLFKRRANLETRSQLGFITTNYDTLLEDALAMDRRIALDGFSGGAIAYWDGASIDPGRTSESRSHQVLKLHGSVDWFAEPQIGLLRVRYGVKYLADLANTLIYPQATKYVETQKDPFAKIFDCLRKVLRRQDGCLLGIVGYSFGDDHINAEIRSALEEPNNRTVVLAFSKEVEAEGGTSVNQVLKTWLGENYGSRVYVATNRALYNGTKRFAPITPEEELTWWSFEGVTKFLESGVAA